MRSSPPIGPGTDVPFQSTWLMQQPGKLYVINPAYAEAEVTAMCLQGLKKRWSPPACMCMCLFSCEIQWRLQITSIGSFAKFVKHSAALGVQARVPA